MAGSMERSQELLRGLRDMPPVHRGRPQPPTRNRDLFSPAMRQGGRGRVTLLERLLAGEYQLRLMLLLGATLLAVLIITVAT